MPLFSQTCICIEWLQVKLKICVLKSLLTNHYNSLNFYWMTNKFVEEESLNIYHTKVVLSRTIVAIHQPPPPPPAPNLESSFVISLRKQVMIPARKLYFLCKTLRIFCKKKSSYSKTTLIKLSSLAGSGCSLHTALLCDLKIKLFKGDLTN